MNPYLEECLKEVQNYQKYQFEDDRANTEAVEAKGPKLVLFEGIGFTFEMKSLKRNYSEDFGCTILSMQHEMTRAGRDYLSEDRLLFLSSKNEAKREEVLHGKRRRLRGRIISEEDGFIFIMLRATEAELEAELDKESYFEFFLGSDEDEALKQYVSEVQQSPEECKLLLKILAYLNDPEGEISAGGRVRATGNAEEDCVKAIITAPEVSLVHTLPNTNGFGVLLKYLESQGMNGKKVLVVSEFQATIPNLITQLVKSKPDWKDKMLRVDEPLWVNEDLALFNLDHRVSQLKKDSEDKSVDFVSLAFDEALFFFSSISSLSNQSIQKHFKANKFDSCVLLNAGQTPFALSLLPIALTKKIVLVGDHFIGYPSVKDSVWKKEFQVREVDHPIYRTSLFERLYTESLKRAEDGQRSISTSITVQNYTSQLMCKSSNDFFYSGLIQTEDSAKRLKLTELSLYNKGTIVNPETCLLWLDHQNPDRAVPDEYANEKEAELVMEVLKDLIINLEVEPQRISVYSPFVYQSQKIKAFIRETFRRNPKEGDKIKVYESIPVQCYPNDVVVFSATRSNRDGDCQGLDERTINKLVTSAKYLFVMVGNKLTLKNIPSYNVPKAKKSFILTLLQNTTLYGEVVVSSLFDRLTKDNKNIQYSARNDGPWIKDLSDSTENFNSLKKPSDGKISTLGLVKGGETFGGLGLGSRGNQRYTNTRREYGSSSDEDEPVYGKHTTGGAFGVGANRSLFNQDSRYKKTELYDELKDLEYKNYRKKMYESYGMSVDQGQKKEFNALEFQGDYDFQFDDETLMKKISQMEEADNKKGKKDQMDDKGGMEDEMTEKPVKGSNKDEMAEKPKEKGTMEAKIPYSKPIDYDEEEDVSLYNRNFVNRKYSHLPVEVKRVFVKHLKMLRYNNLDVYPLNMWFEKDVVMEHEDLVAALLEALSFEEQTGMRRGF